MAKNQIIFDDQMAAQLKGYVTRMVKLKVEIEEHKAELRRLYAEAKACGFNTLAITQNVQRRVLEERARRSYSKVGATMNKDGNDADALYEAILNHKRK